MHYHKPEVHQDDRIMSMRVTLKSLEEGLLNFNFKEEIWWQPVRGGSWSSCLHEIILNLLCWFAS